MNEDNKLLLFTVPISSNRPHPIYGHRHLTKAEEHCKSLDILTAALEGNLKAVLQFVKNGNVEVEDEDGYTPLHNAVSRRHHEVARVLIPVVNINKQSKSGFTPLMNAAAYGDNKMVTMLLEAGTDVGLRNIYGETAYDVAAIAEYASTCEIIQKSEIKWIRSQYARQSNLQLRSHSSIQERLHCNFLEVIHENQRYSMFNFTFSGENLIEADCSLIGGVFSTPFGRSKTFDEVKLPSGSSNKWFWVTDWKIDMSYPNVDEHGWLYATSFEVPDDAWEAIITPSLISRSTWVRRRRWIRVRKQRLSLVETSPESSSTPTRQRIDVNVEDDYIFQALSMVKPSSPKRHNSSASIKGLTTELEIYEEAIQILLHGIKNDQNTERIERAKNLADSYLRHGDTLRSLLETLRGSQPPSSPSESSVANRTATSFSHNASTADDLESFQNISPVGYRRDVSYTQILPAPWQPGVFKFI